MTTVGIVGGLGPESTIDYYRRILAAWERHAPSTSPSIVIDSLDVKTALRLVEHDRAGFTDYLSGSVGRLAAAGADFVAMSANTAHLVFEEVAARSPVSLVSIVETCAAAARGRGLRRLLLLGTRFTMDASFYPAVCGRYGIEVVVPDAGDRAWLHERYVGEFLQGQFRDETRDQIEALVGRLRDAHAVDGVILGGTELPLLLRSPEAARLPLLDTTALHVDAIVERLRAGPAAATSRAPSTADSAGRPSGVAGGAAGSSPAAAEELRAIVEHAMPALLALSSVETGVSRGPGKWSPREIVGHLVDSASTNHQRFLRSRWQEDLVFDGYDQDAWVAAQQYSQAPWVELVALWHAVNLHLARLMAATPETVRRRTHARHSLDRIAFRPVRAGEPTTLEFLMEDYVVHLLHHLRQVLGADWRVGVDRE